MSEISKETKFEYKAEKESAANDLEKDRESLLQFLENNPEARKNFKEIEESYRKQIEKMQEKIESSYLDHATGLENRGQFYKKTGEEAEKFLKKEKTENKCQFFRYGGDEFSGFIAAEDGGLAVIAGDLAYLNRFNDLGGHAGGDLALKSTAELLNQSKEKMNFKGGIEEVLGKLINMIGENSKEVKFPPRFKEMELSIDLGYATIKEAEEIYKELNIDLEGKDKIEKLVDLMVKISDCRVEITKARDRVWQLCRLAEPMAEFYKMDELIKFKEREIVSLIGEEKYEDANRLSAENKELKNKKLTFKEERRENLAEFEETLKFSLKGMAGVRKSDLMFLAGIKDGNERFKKIQEVVEQNIDARNKARAELAEKEIHCIHEMAKRKLPVLKYGV